MNTKKKEFFFDNINRIKGVGKKLSSYLKNKKIEKIKDIIFNFPYSDTDRSKISKLDNLEIGNVNTIKVFVKKIYFPRIRNLPNRIVCEDETGNIDIVYFSFFASCKLSFFFIFAIIFSKVICLASHFL